MARRLLTQALRLAVARAAVTVDAVSVQIGEFAGIEPALLGSAFAQLAVGTIAAGASLEMRIVPLTVRCTVCQREFAPAGFRFQCECCSGAEVEIIAGEDVILEDVTLVEAIEADACH